MNNDTYASIAPSLIISIKPNWCKRILSGEKTVEVRKNFPKISTPFKMLVYCTKGDMRLISVDKTDFVTGETLTKPLFIKARNFDGYYGETGCIVAEAIVDQIVKLDKDSIGYCICDNGNVTYVDDTEEMESRYPDWRTMLSKDEMSAYTGIRVAYLWHIAAVKEYQPPHKLMEIGMKYPPQSWKYLNDWRIESCCRTLSMD